MRMARGCCWALKSKGIHEIFFLSLLGDRIDPTLKMIARKLLQLAPSLDASSL
jgi:hypothetical protein